MDFEIDGSQAKSIFITKTSFNLDSFVGDTNLQSIKLKAYIYLGCWALAYIPVIGFLFGIVSFVSFILLVLAISKASNAPLLLKAIVGFICNFIGAMILSFGAMATVFGGFGGSSEALAGGFGAMILGYLFILCGLVAFYFYYKTLSYVTNEPFFMYAFVCHVLAGLTAIFVIPAIILRIIAVILEVIAWLKFKEIRQIEQTY